MITKNSGLQFEGITFGFAVAALCLLIWATWRQVDLFAIGCDPFGYARQAELFRNGGLLKGLDTRIDTTETQIMIVAAKSVDHNSSNWYQAIAPHCHHYKSAVDRIVLQYPPGTGLVLSFFPKYLSLSYIFILGIALIAIAFTTIVARQPPSVLTASITLGVLALIVWTMTHPHAIASASIPATVMLIPICVLLAFIAFPDSEKNPKLIISLILGFFCGLLLSIRLPNIFLLIGIACQIILNKQLWRLDSIKQSAMALFAVISGFILAGPALIMSANRFNAGSTFSTTYSIIDANLPIFVINTIVGNLGFYFGTSFASFATIGAVIILIIRLFTLKFFPKRARQYGASIGALVCFMLSIVFFSTHQIRVSYYMLPASIMTLFMVVFEINSSNRQKFDIKVAMLRSIIFVFPLVIFTVLRIYVLTPNVYKGNLPDEVYLPQSIVWSDISNGTLIYYHKKYAAKINFSDSCIQDRIIYKIFKMGHTQYFINDSSTMQNIISRVSTFAHLENMGMFDTYRPLPIYKLEAGSNWIGIPCKKI